MQTRTLIAGSIAALLVAGAAGSAAEKSTPPDATLRITVVLNEYAGDKKITSLPYVIPCNASAHAGLNSVEMGFRVPVRVKENEIQYQDVGTHLDCMASPADDQGRFTLQIGVRYSAVCSPAPNQAVGWRPGAPLPNDPIFGGFQERLGNLLLRDGQSAQVATVTDPVSGHVWKVDVTLHVVK